MSAVPTSPSIEMLSRAADPTAGFRRWSTSVALPAAIAAQLICNTLYSIATTITGATDDGGEGTLIIAGEQTGLWLAANWFAILGSLLIIPGAVAAIRVLRPARPRLALIAVTLWAAGYVCYLGINAASFYSIGFATVGVTGPDVQAAWAIGDELRLPLNIVFLLGNMPGTILLGITALISRDIPKFAGIGILAWFVFHLVGLIASNEWFEVAGGILQVAGLSVIASKALHLPLEEWRARG